MVELQIWWSQHFMLKFSSTGAHPHFSREEFIIFLNTSTLAIRKRWSSVSSVTQSCLSLCDCSTPGLPVHHQLPELAQTHVHWVSDAIQSSHPLSSPSPPALNLSQHQGLFQWVSSSHQVTKVLEFQLQHQSFQPSIIHTFYHVSGNPHFQENTMGLLSMAFSWSRAVSIYIYLPYVQNAKLKVKSFFGFSLFLRQMSKSSVHLKGPGQSTANFISISQQHLWCDPGLRWAWPLIASAQLVTQCSSASRSHLKGFSSAFPNHFRPSALHNTLYNRNALSLLFSHSLCLTLCDPMDCSTPGFAVHHQLL